MKNYLSLFFLSVFLSTSIQSQDLGESYLREWRQFYPSKALKSGIRSFVFQYEQLSSDQLQQWVDYNQQILVELSKEDVQIDPINGRLLRVKAQSEIDKWHLLSTHTTSLRLYAQLILKAVPSIFDAEYLLAPEKSRLICSRLQAMEKLSLAAIANLRNVSKSNLDSGLSDLSKSLQYLKDGLKEELKSQGLAIACSDFDTQLKKTIQSLDTLMKYGQTTLQKTAKDGKTLIGKEEFDRRLKLYTDSDLTSTTLAAMALQEIETTKGLMARVAKEYLLSTFPNKTLPKEDAAIIEKALADMEKDAPLNAEAYLEFWQQLAEDAINFIREKNIATLPKYQTLQIQTAPESAGAAARIGWVDAAPPFAPNPITTLYLPSIPDTLPKQEQIDFWASFNRPFNRMIAIHELLPGHYMQLKISRETPHPIRLVFPYGPYIEGWATFVERVLLDEGWQAGKHLTYLAHLRKRLENANRTYTSVQAHCNGWTPAQVRQFSIETSLLAPQFAKSLWGRIERSPMQLTSYYYGGAQFSELLQKEKQRLGSSFNLKLFMDTIMKAGPIPVDEFYSIFKHNQAN